MIIIYENTTQGKRQCTAVRCLSLSLSPFLSLSISRAFIWRNQPLSLYLSISHLFANKRYHFNGCCNEYEIQNAKYISRIYYAGHCHQLLLLLLFVTFVKTNMWRLARLFLAVAMLSTAIYFTWIDCFIVRFDSIIETV